MGHPLSEGRIERDNSERGKDATEQKALTSWRPKRDGQSWDTRRMRLSEKHSLSGDSIGGDRSGYGKKATEQGTLTPWGSQKEGQVRTRKERKIVKATHSLETTSGATIQET